jgi:hypothetical protein
MRNSTHETGRTVRLQDPHALSNLRKRSKVTGRRIKRWVKKTIMEQSMNRNDGKKSKPKVAKEATNIRKLKTERKEKTYILFGKQTYLT